VENLVISKVRKGSVFKSPRRIELSRPPVVFLRSGRLFASIYRWRITINNAQF